jgi:hypothetical protein
MMELKEYLLAELKPVDGTSEVTASGEAYDENLHCLMQTFWEMFNSGQIAQKVTCTICSSIILQGGTIQQTPVAIFRITS